MNKDLISYAQDFTSFLVKNTSNFDNFKNVVLFGSVARNEADENSDVDIFIELQKPDKSIQEEIKKIRNKFFDSVKFKQYWNLLDIKNDFNILSGTFYEWKELKNSIVLNGIVLYGKFSAMLEGRQTLIVQLGEIKPNSKRVLFNKKIFGYKQNKKQYEGILQKYGGEKLGKGVILISLESGKELKELSQRFKLGLKITRVCKQD